MPKEVEDNLTTKSSALSDPTSKAIEEAARIAEKFLGDLIEPGLKETGGILSDTVKFWRFKNQVNLVLKAKKFLESKGIKPSRVLPKTLFPILENGALEEDSDMQTRWAAMLANSADPNSELKIRPSYPEILKELSPLEAQILDNFYSSVIDKPKNERAAIGISKEKVLKVFNLSSDEYEIIADNLFRLNLCQPPTSEGGISIGEYPVALRTYEFIKLTPLGVDFIRSCRFEDQGRIVTAHELMTKRNEVNIPDELIEKYAAHVIQVGGVSSRQTTKSAWLLTEEAYISPADKYAIVTFNKGGDVMGLLPHDGFRITNCWSPSGNQVLVEPEYPLGCRIRLEDKLKNEIIIECEKIVK